MPGPNSAAAPKPASRARQRQTSRNAKAQAWQRVRRAVLVRDGWRCRVCHELGGVDVHHIKFRSAGRKDSTENCCCLCKSDHADVHAYRLAIDGNADKTLRVTRL